MDDDALFQSQGPLATAIQGTGTLATALNVLTQMYDRYQRNREQLSEEDAEILDELKRMHSEAGCSDGATPPPELTVDRGEDGKQRKPMIVQRDALEGPLRARSRVTPGSAQLSMRIEIKELIDVLVVLEDVHDTNLKKKPCALWQVVMELNRWMTTELPQLLDATRGPAGSCSNQTHQAPSLSIVIRVPTQ